MIDPDILNLKDLAEPTVGNQAIALWKERRSKLDRIPQGLQESYEKDGFEGILKQALGDPQNNNTLPCDLDQLLSQLETDKAETRLYEGKCRDRNEVGRSTLFYMFARGRHTNTVYWSAYDPKASNQDYAQSFWEPVPELKNVTKIIGSHPYTITDKERYVYLFAIVREGGTEKLVFVKYNLETQAWENESVELKVPEGV